MAAQRDWQAEYEGRVAWIRDLVKSSGVKGIVFGNSGGKDSALVGILCKAACDNTVGIIMPCASKRNYGEDAEDGRALAEQYGIEIRTVDLTAVREQELQALQGVSELNDAAVTNIAPRLRMTTLYAIAAAENRLVAGTGKFALLNEENTAHGCPVNPDCAGKGSLVPAVGLNDHADGYIGINDCAHNRPVLIHTVDITNKGLLIYNGHFREYSISGTFINR